ncbi:MAG: transcription antitermination factor NusB [Polyangiaceae bacterium]
MTKRTREQAPTGRSVAVKVLERVETNKAYAAAALDAELARAKQLDVRDRGLCTEIVYGVLRTRRALEARLARHMSAGLARTEPWLRLQLLVAAYQILALDRVPAHAAVDAAVTEVRARRGPKPAGFVNAVLRKLSAEERGFEVDEAIWNSVPDWLRARLVAAVGEEDARALLCVGAGSGTWVRAVDERARPDWLAEAEPDVRVPGAYRSTLGGDLRAREGWDSGAFVIQELGSQILGHALAAVPGERVLDACAGRGQKTSLLRECVGNSSELWAADLHPHKLRALQAEFERLRLSPPRIAAVDWTRGSGEVPLDTFDRVLVDAPCTGTGTLRRRPEITSRLTPEDPARMSRLAEQILRSAANCARPGGRIVFAVCSVMPEEGTELVKRVRDVLDPAPFDAPLARALAGDGVTEFRLLPTRHGTEGYFVASFVRPARGHTP